jgi:hypothetical protein
MKAAALELRTGLASSEELEQDATSKLEVRKAVRIRRPSDFRIWFSTFDV